MGGAEQQLEALARRYEHRVGFFASKVQRSFMLGSRWNDDLASRVWKRIAIREALNQLGDDDRRMIVAYMQGFSLCEIARDEGIATGTAQTRFRKLSQTLRARAPGLRRILLDREGS